MVNLRTSEPRLGDTQKVDYKALADKKFGEWGTLLPRSGRMQKDADFFNMVSATTKLLDADNKEIPNSVHVLLNDIATFTWEVETELNAAIEQVSVTSKNKRFDTAYVEGFIKAAFKEADKRLSLKGMFPFDPFIDQQTFRRGRASSKCFFHFDKGEFIPDLTPWDTGYVVPENDTKGLYYIAGKFYRPESKILTDFTEANGYTISNTTSNTNIEVIHILTRDTSQIWVGGSLAKELPNKLGYVPAVYHLVPMGSMLWDKDTIQYMGESGIFLIRKMFEELERIVSIIQSLSLKVVDQALQIPMSATNSSGNATPAQTVDELNAPGSVNEVPENTRYELMPLGQLQAAFDILYQKIQEGIQRGTSQRFRNVANPPTATQIMLEDQEQGNIVLPRLRTRGLLKQDLSYMFIRQTIEASKKAKVRTVKLDGEDWEVSKLEGDYSIEFKYHFHDPRMDAARQSLATAQRGQRPDGWILRNTLMSEDPEGEERLLAMEKARAENPLAALDWEITKLLEAADEGDTQAEYTAMELAMIWIPAAKQAMQGLMTPNMPEPLKPSQPLVPLLSERAGGNGGQQNAG